MFGFRRCGALLLVMLLLAPHLSGQKRKKKNPEDLPVPVLEPQTLDPVPGKKRRKDEITQVLPAVKEPPAAVTGSAERLSFDVSPLSGKGLLSQQTRDALKVLFGQSRGAPIIRIRAFVAGSGDLRRVKEIVSEVFAERRMNLPVVTTIQVGGLPMDAAQVVLEATLVERKPVNEHGLAFVSGQVGKMAEPLAPLVAALEKHRLEKAAVLRVTCFLSHLDTARTLRGQAATQFPKASTNFVQLQRGFVGDFAECEAVAQLSSKPDRPTFLEPAPSRYSQVALVPPGELAFTSLQMAFQDSEEGARLAFERLRKALESVHTDFRHVVMSCGYPLSNATAELVRKVRRSFYDPKLPPASTMVLFEGLPSLDAAFGIDVVAAIPRK